jgi:hypothetical protein
MPGVCDLSGHCSPPPSASTLQGRAAPPVTSFPNVDAALPPLRVLAEPDSVPDSGTCITGARASMRVSSQCRALSILSCKHVPHMQVSICGLQTL